MKGEKYICASRRCRVRYGCNFTGEVGNFNYCWECEFRLYGACPADEFFITKENTFCPQCVEENNRSYPWQPWKFPPMDELLRRIAKYEWLGFVF